MNIFFLSPDPVKSARLYHNKHVGKILLEICQLLYAAIHICGMGVDWEIAPTTAKGNRGYKMTHKNHPMSLWVRATQANYDYAVSMGMALAEEFCHRRGKRHACEEHIKFLGTQRIRDQNEISQKSVYGTTGGIPSITKIPLCMPEEYHDESAIRAYENYYIYKNEILS